MDRREGGSEELRGRGYDFTSLLVANVSGEVEVAEYGEYLCCGNLVSGLPCKLLWLFFLDLLCVNQWYSDQYAQQAKYGGSILQALEELAERDLLRRHAAVIAELKRRGVVNNANNPIGGYTEWLVCRRMELRPAPNNQTGYDATNDNGDRFQIKGRRSAADPVQFSPIRNFNKHNFDFVIAVIYDEDYLVRMAAMIPYEIVPALSRFQRYINGHILSLNQDSLNRDGVRDIRVALEV